MVTVACQRAYCSSFNVDQPNLCRLDPSSSDQEALLESWDGFVPVVLGVELGVEPDSPLGELLSLGVGRGLFDAVVASSSQAESGESNQNTSGPRLMVRLERVGSEYRVGATLADAAQFGPWTLPLAPNEGDFAGLLENAMRQTAGSGAVVEVSGEIPQAVVVALFDALRSGGIEEVALSE
jgi:hypothetical protein